tara:strand:- start:5752 stop:7956 length:2205 start_codon:yes stop_codon:yes gene_type:complete
MVLETGSSCKIKLIPKSRLQFMTQLENIFKKYKHGTIWSIAGSGYKTGVPAKEADIGWPSGIVRRPDGDLVFGDMRSHRLWRIDSKGILHNFVGDGIPGTLGDGGHASNARVYTPHDLCQDEDGNIFFTELGSRGPDEGPNTVRMVDYKSGIITKVAGSGKIGRGGEGLDAKESEFDTTSGIAVDKNGNIYLCHKWDSKVTRVDVNSKKVETIAGQPTRNYLLETGNSRPFSGSNFSFKGSHGDGGPAKEAALGLPEHLAFDSKGDLYICDNGNNRIRKISMETGIISTVLGTGVSSSYGDGGPAVEAATDTPDSIHIDKEDNIYVGEASGNRIRKIDNKTGTVSTIVGTGIPGWGKEKEIATDTMTNAIEAGIWTDPDGTVLYSDSSGRIRKIDPTTNLTTTVVGGTSIHDGDLATNAFVSNPRGLAVGHDGSVYVADMQSDRIRRIDPNTLLIETVAGSGGRGFGGNGGLATEAYFLNPYDVAIDVQGRLVIADTLNAQIRRVEHDGTIASIAGTGTERADRGDGGPAVSASFVTTHAVACGPDGEIYIGDSIGRIRVVNPSTGIISTFAGIGLTGYSGDGGYAIEAQIGCPSSISLDKNGNVYFTDLTHHVVRKIDQDGIITTLAGTSNPGFSEGGEYAVKANLRNPMGITVGRDERVYFSDSRNNCVRTIDTDGKLLTIAGNPIAGDEGDGESSTKPSLNNPTGLALYGEDILLISDHYNNRIKAVKIDS